jgi:hypothetical protein
MREWCTSEDGSLSALRNGTAALRGTATRSKTADKCRSPQWRASREKGTTGQEVDGGAGSETAIYGEQHAGLLVKAV